MPRSSSFSPLTRAEIEPVLAPLDLARPFPSRAFVDDEVFAFEEAMIFGRSWMCVGREDEVALPGQWLRETVASEPILVVRGADLRLRAFFDVCRHRGASIVSRAPCGRAAKSQLVCPYHGWTYELDGRLANAAFTPPSFDEQRQRENGLREARVEAWRGFVFVTLDPDAPPLDQFLGDSTPPWLTSVVLSSLKLGRRMDYVVHANWKLLVENFQESHHFTSVHKALEALTPTGEARTWIPSDAQRGPWLGGTMAIESNAETVSLDGSRHERPLLVVMAPNERPTVFDAMLFPGLFTSLQPDYLLTYRLVPIATSRTRIVADIYFHPAAFVATFDPADVYHFWDRVNAEDKAICEDQQANAGSRAFDPACYVTVEEGMHAFDRLVAQVHLAYLDEREKQR